MNQNGPGRPRSWARIQRPEGLQAQEAVFVARLQNQGGFERFPGLGRLPERTKGHAAAVVRLSPLGGQGPGGLGRLKGLPRLLQFRQRRAQVPPRPCLPRPFPVPFTYIYI